MKRKIFIFLMAMIGIKEGYSQHPGGIFTRVGSSGAVFLKIWAEPKGTAMSGARVAIATDVTGLYWNPAGLAYMTSRGIVVSHMDWVIDINKEFIGAALPLGKLLGTVGISVSALTMGKEEQTTVTHPEGTGRFWDANDIAVAFSYARELTDKFAFGITMKYIQQRIWTMKAHGFAVDLGGMLNVSSNCRGGFVIKNYGPPIKFSGGELMKLLDPYDWKDLTVEEIEMEYQTGEAPLPLMLLMGIGIDVLDFGTNKLTVVGMLNHPNDGEEKIHLGIEWNYQEVLFLRGGCKYDPDTEEGLKKEFWLPHENTTAGVGIRVANWSVNYALYNMWKLGIRHQISLEIEH
jgi:hypothetical protein